MGRQWAVWVWIGWMAFSLFINPTFAYCQEPSEKEVLSMKASTEKADKLAGLSYKYISSDPQKALRYGEEVLQISRALNYEFGILDANNILGAIHLQTGDYNKALAEFLTVLKLAEKSKHNNIVATALNNIGNVYNRQQEHKKALEYFLQSIELKKKNPDARGLCIAYMNIGGIYFELKDTAQAIQMFDKALEFTKAGKDEAYRPMILSNMAMMIRKKDPEKARQFYEEAIQLRRAKGDLSGLSASLLNAAALYNQTGDTARGLAALYESLQLAEQLGHTSRQMTVSLALSELYRHMNRPDSAYSYLKAHLQLKDTIFQADRQKDIAELETKYNVEKKQQQIEVLEKENQLKALRSLKQEQEIELLGQKAALQEILNEKRRKELEILNVTMQQEEADSRHRIELLQRDKAFQASALEKNRFILYLTLGGTLALSLMAVSIARTNRIRKKTNQLLSATNEEINRQKTIIEEKNRSITDSIEYASTIQEAILPSPDEMKRIFPAHFIFYQPKDIVSGDFYWITETTEYKFLVVADCTGHGVPGALMSMIGNSLLTQIIRQNKTYEPGKILDELTVGIVDALKQGTGSRGKDGMDVSLVRLDKNSDALAYAGANNPCWVLGSEGLAELKPNKQPVGFSYTAHQPFTTHYHSLQSGDLVVLFTDGFADQFGGEKGKKLKHKKFREVLLEMHRQQVEPGKGLKEFFMNWKGNLEQVDDVCVVAILR